MYWTVYIVIAFLLVALTGLLVRVINFRKFLGDGYMPYDKPHKRYFLDGSTFYSRMRTHVGLTSWLLILLGLPLLSLHWFSALEGALLRGLEIGGILLLIFALFKMNIWPWSPAYMSIAPLHSMTILKARGWSLWDSGINANIGVGHPLVGSAYIHAERMRYRDAAEWKNAVINNKKFSVSRADLGGEAFDLALVYLAKIGCIQESSLPERLQEYFS